MHQVRPAVDHRNHHSPLVAGRLRLRGVSDAGCSFQRESWLLRRLSAGVTGNSQLGAQHERYDENHTHVYLPG
jgi:hypothetical protein